MRNELIAGLRNALERGSSLQKAKESLINAGYNPQEVASAAEELTTGVSEIVFSAKNKEGSRELPPLPPVKKTETPKTDRKMIIVLVILIALVFVAGAGFLIYSLLK